MRKKILLVDDSITVLMLEQMMLTDEPYDLVTASDGIEAIAKASAERPDLILMDANMPGLNGFEASRILRGRELTRATPILMVTTPAEARRDPDGFDGYVIKPINGDELLSQVRGFLGE